MLTPHVAFTWFAIANIDQDFVCRSFLGLQENSFEELIYHNKKIYWTRWRVLIKVLPVYHVETIRKVYRMSIYICYHKDRLQTIKKVTQLNQSSQHFPYIFDYY